MPRWARVRALGVGSAVGVAVGLALVSFHQPGLVAALGNRIADLTAREPAIRPKLDHLTTDGRRVDEAALRGRASVVTFVFTHCPDVCPTTLADMAGWMAALGSDAGRIDWYAVTLDPQRDVPQGDASGFRDYLAAFDERIVGLHAGPEVTEAAARSFRVTYRKVVLEGSAADYTIDHSAGVYLLDATGRYHAIIGLGESAEGALAKLRRLLHGGS